jgi:acylphosphatase
LELNVNNLAKVRLKVKGRVQGVFFRQSTKDKAVALGLSGWVRNEDDGSVLVEAIGPKEALGRLILWAQQGPPSAKVDNVDVSWLEPTAEDAAAFRASADTAIPQFRITG